MIPFIKELLDKESKYSSKRFMGITLLGWSMTMGTYYIIVRQHFDGVESMSSVGIIEFAIVSGVGLLAGGTAAEALSKKRKNE